MGDANQSPTDRSLWVQSQGQIEFYDDPELIGPAGDAVAAFFGGH